GREKRGEEGPEISSLVVAEPGREGFVRRQEAHGTKSVPWLPLRSRRLVPRGHGLVAQRQPAVLVFGTSFDDGKEFFLKSPGDGSGLAAADHDAVNGADGSYFGCGPSEENFVGDIEHFAGNHLLDQRVAELPRQRNDGVAGDTRQNRAPESRRKDLP